MSWSFVLSTVIYYSFSFIDVYELKHKMILKCSLIEAAVDTVTMTAELPAAHESRSAVRGSRAGAGERVLEPQLGWCWTNASVYLHRVARATVLPAAWREGSHGARVVLGSP